jgi:preprotein translocase SecE subunit
VAEEPEAKKSKRRVKNPETFRQQALKAASEANKPVRPSRIKKVWAPFRFIGRFFRFLNRFTPLRILGLILFPPYFRNSWKELQQVTWPTFKQSLRLTWAVLLFAIIFGASVAAVDYGLEAVFKRILLK